MAMKLHDAAVPLGSTQEVDVGQDHGPMNVRGLSSTPNGYYRPDAIRGIVKNSGDYYGPPKTK